MRMFRIDKRRKWFKKQREFAKKIRNTKLFDYILNDLRNSTTHGVPYIGNSDLSWFERVFWAVCFIICFLVAVMLLISQYQRFIETPTVMSVEMDYFNWNVSYPAFTLCPYIKPDTEMWQGLLNETKDQYGHQLDDILWAIVSSNMDTLDRFNWQKLNQDQVQLINPKDYVKLALEVFQYINEGSVTSNNNWFIKFEAVMTELGMCHVFNSNVAKYDKPMLWMLNFTSTYINDNIQLSIHDRDFFAQVLNYDPITKIFIHDPDEIILSTSPSYTQTETGFLTFGVQVHTTRISSKLRRFSKRIRKCRFINEPISRRYPVYSYNHCLLECRIIMIKRICGCVPHFYKPIDNERVCNLFELKCVLKYRKEILALSATAEMSRKFSRSLPKSPRDCGCIGACDSDKYLKDFESFMHQKGVNRLRIGISSFPKVRVVRDIIFSYYDIILRSGGVVNLCIGSSIISIMELAVRNIKVICFYFKIFNTS